MKEKTEWDIDLTTSKESDASSSRVRFLRKRRYKRERLKQNRRKKSTYGANTFVSMNGIRLLNLREFYPEDREDREDRETDEDIIERERGLFLRIRPDPDLRAKWPLQTVSASHETSAAQLMPQGEMEPLPTISASDEASAAQLMSQDETEPLQAISASDEPSAALVMAQDEMEPIGTSNTINKDVVENAQVTSSNPAQISEQVIITPVMKKYVKNNLKSIKSKIKYQQAKKEKAKEKRRLRAENSDKIKKLKRNIALQLALAHEKLAISRGRNSESEEEAEEKLQTYKLSLKTNLASTYPLSASEEDKFATAFEYDFEKYKDQVFEKIQLEEERIHDQQVAMTIEREHLNICYLFYIVLLGLKEIMPKKKSVTKKTLENVEPYLKAKICKGNFKQCVLRDNCVDCATAKIHLKLTKEESKKAIIGADNDIKDKVFNCLKSYQTCGEISSCAECRNTLLRRYAKWIFYFDKNKQELYRVAKLAFNQVMETLKKFVKWDIDMSDAANELKKLKKTREYLKTVLELTKEECDT